MKNPRSKMWPVMALFLAAFASLASAVPSEVESSFKSRYGDVGKVEWEMDAHGYWEGKFDKDGKSYRADFEKKGDWVETERSLKFADLPDAVQSAIRAEHGDRKIAEIEEVDSKQKGLFYDIEFTEKGKNEDVEYNKDGEPIAETMGILMGGLEAPMPDIENGKDELEQMTLGQVMMEFGVNLISILIYACLIYYMRHHNHKMMFLLLAFNLFLFPIFLLSSVLTMGFGFTIFALLALVRLRSENFDKAEVAYLLGAVALTFINSQLSANIEIAATGIVLATAYLADHPRLWASAYQTAEIRYRISDTKRMLDRDYLAKVISEEFNIIVNAVEIERVARKEVRLNVVYSDPENPSVLKKKRKKEKKEAKKAKEEKKEKEAESDDMDD
ncbi:MAG: DUF4956 domain-containing protein [Luteolibacter sp.]